MASKSSSSEELSYSQLASEAASRFACGICDCVHRPNEPCPSKPPLPPWKLFPRCSGCKGYHRLGRCDNAKLTLAAASITHCARCKTRHSGYCYEDNIYCANCNNHHNPIDECTWNTAYDVSNNYCLNCKSLHTGHCHNELWKVRSNSVLYCNRCKQFHTWLKCSILCRRCGRPHNITEPCPPANPICQQCNVPHRPSECPFWQQPIAKLNSIRDLSTPGLPLPSTPNDRTIRTCPSLCNCAACTNGILTPGFTSPFPDLPFDLSTLNPI